MKKYKFLTIHYKTTHWVDIQKRYLDEFVGEYEYYALFNDIPKEECSKYSNRFDKLYEFNSDARKGDDNHIDGLQYLIKKVSDYSSPNDVFIVLDSDAFPISNDFIKLLNNKIEKFPAISVQRVHNDRDLQPHPIFFASTFEFWNSHNLTFERGLVNPYIPLRRTGTGGAMLQYFIDNNIDWYKVHKSNYCQIVGDSLAEVYEDCLFHLGGGSHGAMSSSSTAYARRKGIDIYSLEIRKPRELFYKKVIEEIDNDFFFFKNYLY